MKKRSVILFFLSTILIFQSQAQLKWGYKLGFGLANVSYPLLPNGGRALNLFSYQIGIVNETMIGKSMTIQPAIIFCKKGSSAVNATYPTHYLDVPVNFIYKVNKNFQLGTGPVLSFLLINDTSKSYKKMEIGGCIIAGYILDEDSSLNLSYTFSLDRANELGTPAKNLLWSFSFVKFVDLSDLGRF
jgi:Outer membrane protein beta-barrel domain